MKKKSGLEFKWLENDCIQIISETIPAIRFIASQDGNYIFQYTFYNSIIAAFIGWEDSRNNRFQAVRFGDNTEMPFDILEKIANFMEKSKISFAWKKGDILAIHNDLVMHSRNPFSGPRQIYASIWGNAVLNSDLSDSSCASSHDLEKLSEPTDPLVFGFWKVPRDKCQSVTYDVISNGYRRLDCACDYGNEEQVGLGIEQAVKDKLCRRGDLYVTSKLWNTFHYPDHVSLAFHKSLSDLKLDYLDEYLIHFPISMQYIPIDQKYPPEWYLKFFK